MHKIQNLCTTSYFYIEFLHLSQLFGFAKVFIVNIFKCLLQQSLILPLHEDGNE
jgi:hypothetical protein